MSEAKSRLRAELRRTRRNHVETLPAAVQALVFKAPPSLLLERILPDAQIGLYCASRHEAPTARYAQFFAEAGNPLALPHLSSETAEMTFRAHNDPFAQSDLAPGPFGLLQPSAQAPICFPDVIFVPILGFTVDGRRLGQGGGYYDRYLAHHHQAFTIGLAWDVQCIEAMPVEDHDVPLDAIVTPTRLLGPF